MQTLGIIGGGQLALMICWATKKWNINTIVLDPNKECSAKQAANKLITGAFSDISKLEQLFLHSDKVIYEFENLDCQILSKISNIEKCIQGINVLRICQDRLLEKNFIYKKIKIPVANYQTINHEKINKLLNQNSRIKFILKSRKFGYDGHKQIEVIKKNKQKIFELINNYDCIIEEKINLVKEFAITGYRIGNKNYFLPITENIHKNHILFKSKIINKFTISKKIQNNILNAANKIMTNFNNPGIYTIEFFLDNKENILVNEIAPRVHNSSHHSVLNCKYSQFDAAIMAAFNISKNNFLLGDYFLINILGQNYSNFNKNDAINYDFIFIDYLKNEIRQNRKMGHILIPNNEKLINKVVTKYNLWK